MAGPLLRKNEHSGKVWPPILSCAPAVMASGVALFAVLVTCSTFALAFHLSALRLAINALQMTGTFFFLVGCFCSASLFPPRCAVCALCWSVVYHVTVVVGTLSCDALLRFCQSQQVFGGLCVLLLCGLHPDKPVKNNWTLLECC